MTTKEKEKKKEKKEKEKKEKKKRKKANFRGKPDLFFFLRLFILQLNTTYGFLLSVIIKFYCERMYWEPVKRLKQRSDVVSFTFISV